MRSFFGSLRTLVLPSGAGTGARIVLGPDVPADLAAFYLATYGATIAAAILSYRNTTDYYYDAAIATGFTTTAHARGISVSGNVEELELSEFLVAPLGIQAFYGSPKPGQFTYGNAVRANAGPTSEFVRIDPSQNLDIVSGGGFYIDGVTAERALKARIDSSALAIGPAAGENIVLTMPSAGYLAGRAYRVGFSYLAGMSVAGALVTQVRKGTTVAGTQLHGARQPAPTIGTLFTQFGYFYLVNATGATVTTQMVLTVTPSGGNVTVSSTAQSVALFEAKDCGAAADFANAIQI
jgi:hypothetical protein